MTSTTPAEYTHPPTRCRGPDTIGWAVSTWYAVALRLPLCGRARRALPCARPHRRAALAVVVPSVLLAGCATNPVSRRPEITLVSEAKERELGAAEAKRVSDTMGLVEDPALTTYVRAVGERLARVSPRADVPYTFAVVDAAEPNAFALPGGPVYVSRGLFALLNSEDELAARAGWDPGGLSRSLHTLVREEALAADARARRISRPIRRFRIASRTPRPSPRS